MKYTKRSNDQNRERQLAKSVQSDQVSSSHILQLTGTVNPHLINLQFVSFNTNKMLLTSH